MNIVSGVVIEGRQHGRELGYPTANVILTMPISSGIYFGQAKIKGKKYKGAAFIPPEMNLFEIFFLDFKGDLYGQELRVELGKKIREFKKFTSVEDLKKQIANDVAQVRKIKLL